MSSEAVGRFMPADVTLADLTPMMAADEHHRYEISPEGVLSVTPSPGYAHAIIATELMGWLLAGGVPAKRVAQAVGLRIPGRRGGVGGRIPDLVVWSKIQAEAIWLPVTDVLLVAEILSPGSEGTDQVTKRAEYAGAGIPQYWVIDQDPAQTVTMHRLESDHYAVQASMPLAWLLSTKSAEHGLHQEPDVVAGRVVRTVAPAEVGSLRDASMSVPAHALSGLHGRSPRSKSHPLPIGIT